MQLISRFLLITLFFLPLMGIAKTEESLDRIVAIVNDSVITQSELNEALKLAKSQLAGQQTLSSSELRKKVLDQLINRKLQLQLAEQAGIHIGDAEVNKALTEVAARNQMTVAQLYERVKAEGLTPAEYRKDIREELTLQRVQQQEVGSKIIITPEEVKSFALTHQASPAPDVPAEYHLEDILINVPDNPTSQQMAAARKRAEELIAKINQGTPFKTIAAAEGSEDLGWRPLSQIPAAFVNAIAQIKVHHISEPIEAPNGFHILYLAGMRTIAPPAGVIPPAKQIEQLLFQKKYEEALERWVAKLRSDAVINLNPTS